MTELGNHLVESVWGRPLGLTGQGVVVAIAFSILTLAHVFFGELVPKLVAIQRSKQAAAVTVPLLRVAYVLLYPGLWVLEACSRAVLKLINLPFDAYGEAALSEDEILGILAANVAREPRGEQKHELMRRVVRFSARTAKAVMIPRVDVASLPVETPGSEAIEFVRQQQYSRVLLHKGDSLDDVVGYLYAKDFVFDQNAQSLADLRSIRRDVLFVPETQGSWTRCAACSKHILRSPWWSTNTGGPAASPRWKICSKRSWEIFATSSMKRRHASEKKGMAWEVDGRVTLGELGPIGVDAEDVQRGESVGAVVMARLKRLPRVGDKVDLGGMTAEVMHIARRRVTRVRVQPLPEVEVAKG